MITELPIAKKNIEFWQLTKPKDGDLWRLNIWFNMSKQHKAHCKRELAFLKSFKWDEFVYKKTMKCLCDIEDRKENLKQTIKLYKENGI